MLLVDALLDRYCSTELRTDCRKGRHLYYASFRHRPGKPALKLSSRNCLVAITVIAIAGCDTTTTELRFVTPTEPVDREIVEDLGGLLSHESEIDVMFTSSALSEQAALDALSSGEADIALVSNDLPFRTDIATVMPLYPTVLHVGHFGDDDEVFGLEMLRGKTVYAGTEGSASRYVFERIAHRIHLNADDYRYVDHFEERPDIVIVFSPISPDRLDEVRDALQDYPEFQLMSMGVPEDIGKGTLIDAALLMNPNFRPFVIPTGTYGESTSEPVLTVAVDKMLVARRELPSASVYYLVNEILRLRPAMSALRPGLFESQPGDFDISRSRYIVHAGAQAYLQRDAPSIYERYSGIAEVVATVVIGLVSAIFAGLRLYKMRRKNLIDTFYVRAIALQRGIDDETSDEDRQRIAGEIRDLQTKAFDLLVDEKLAADESFRIFITLSNDVLRQLDAPGAASPISSA